MKTRECVCVTCRESFTTTNDQVQQCRTCADDLDLQIARSPLRTEFRLFRIDVFWIRENQWNEA